MEFRKHEHEIIKVVGKSMSAINTNLIKLDHQYFSYLPVLLMSEQEKKHHDLQMQQLEMQQQI